MVSAGGCVAESVRRSWIESRDALARVCHSSLVEIEAAVDKLGPEEAKEFAAWFARRQALLNSAEAVF